MTPLTKFLINERWEAFRARDWARYNHLREKVKREISRAKSIWAEKVKSSSNGLWKLVKKVGEKGRNDPFSRLIHECGSAQALLDIFVKSLSQDFSANSGPCGGLQSESLSEGAARVLELHLSDAEVRRRIMKLSPSKSPGSDGIPNTIYRVLADALAKPLAAIFNKSIQSYTFPTDWKKRIMVPISKCNPPSIDEMKFITHLPTPSKILEKLVQYILSNM